jgi:hypothetical protein
MPKEHKCPRNRFIDTGTRILYGPSIEDGWQSWILEVPSITDEKAVRDGEAETVGAIRRNQNEA